MGFDELHLRYHVLNSWAVAPLNLLYMYRYTACQGGLVLGYCPGRRVSITKARVVRVGFEEQHLRYQF